MKTLEAPALQSRSDSALSLQPRAAVAVLAVGIAALAMRGAWSTGPVDFDAARHSLNGALIYDMVREGGLSHPVEYTRRYFSRLPGVSIPYHPPGFPVFEAAVFSIFGVNYPAARFAIALTIACSVVLLFLLARNLSGSNSFAFAATALFYGLPVARMVSGDVMLEFPSLMLVLAALLVLERVFYRGTPYRGALWFGVVAAAAIWTKQNTLFLAVIPIFAATLLQGRNVVRLWRVWVASGVIVAAALALLMIMKLSGSTSNPGWHYNPVHQIVAHHLLYYSKALWNQLTLAGAFITLGSILWFLYERWRHGFTRHTSVICAWLASATALLLVLPPSDIRYAIYILPALVIVDLMALAKIAQWLSIPRQVRAVIAAVLAVLLWVHSTKAAAQLRGLPEAAAYLAGMNPDRLLLCSARNGSFTFAFRSAQQSRATVVLRGESMDQDFFTPAAFGAFLHDYGIEYVVIHDSPVAEPYDNIAMQISGQLRLERTFEVTGSVPDTGTVRVYRNLKVSKTPANEFGHKGRIGSRILDLR